LTGATQAPTTRSSRVQATVLAVDDTPANLVALRAALEPLEEHVVEATTGEEALKYLLNHDCAVILLDAHLPGMSGFEVAEVLRSRERTRDIPILFVTGTMQDKALTGYAQGAFDYIVKPYDPDALRAKVAAIVKLYRQRRQAEQQRDLLAQAEKFARAETASERTAMYALLAQAPALIARLRGPNHFFEFANAPYIEVIGNRNPVGKTVREALPELAGQPYFELLDQVFTTGEPYKAEEVPVRIPQGPGRSTEIFLNFVYQPTRDPYGRVDGILVHAVDVTAQVRSRQSIELMAEALPQQVWTAAPGGRLEFVNHKVVEYTGLTRQQLFEEGWLGLVHPDDSAVCRKSWGEALAGAKDCYEAELRLRRADGEFRWHLCRALPSRDAAGAVTHWYGTFTDIHDQRAAAEQVARFSAFQQQLLAVVGHDLRNPLNAILVGAQLNSKVVDDPKVQATAARVLRSAARMKRILDDLVDFTRARIGTGLAIKRQPCNPGELCAEVVEELEAFHRGRTIRLERESDCEGLWDPSRLQQMASNLISNALQYSPPESPVVARLSADDRELRLEVTNRGEPIPPEVLQTLFEPFKRGDEQLPAGANLGLGLYIVDQVVRAHGGSVKVSSDREAGTSFSVRLPRVR
jgi:PAS domain S-box-containing protein